MQCDVMSRAEASSADVRRESFAENRFERVLASELDSIASCLALDIEIENF